MQNYYQFYEFFRILLWMSLGLNINNTQIQSDSSTPSTLESTFILFKNEGKFKKN